MTWLAWRQARTQIWCAAAATVAVVVILVVTRHHVSRFAGSEDLSTGYKSLQLLGTALIGLPAFIGAFWGAPLLAREFEMGTYRLAWTQSVTRNKWLAVKLAVVASVAVIVAAGFSLVFTWWSLPFDASGNRIGTANFGQRGIAPIAYTVFALALGTLLGTIIKRTLPAMAATLAGFFLVRFLFQLLVRPHLLASVTMTRAANLFGYQQDTAGNRGWTVSSHLVDGRGRVTNSSTVDRLMGDACHLDRYASRSDYLACVKRLGIRDIATIHPADQFWPLQLRESVAFVLLAAALVAITFWWIRRRAS